ncbi:MAG: carboxypeptidase-like regulatory domain-containing protein [Cyclobacterium sp.]|uniref:carboxypeptidase-like regulatory domain-containing protein n=1 Tax=Cyclobacterium sp. TaxID=1966343 RepID=UPI0039711777
MEKVLQQFKSINKKAGLLTLLLSLMMTWTALAQITVSGVVKDGVEDLPLPGVSVYQKGGNNVSITDIDGAYNIEVASSQSELVFSFIGFETQNIIVGDRSTIDVTLSAEETLL